MEREMKVYIREKFATQVNTKIIADVRKLAEIEGRQIQALVDEAFADLLRKRSQENRTHAVQAYLASCE
jgi:hypothetical protein